jgi:hypothetical protein
MEATLDRAARAPARTANTKLWTARVLGAFLVLFLRSLLPLRRRANEGRASDV